MPITKEEGLYRIVCDRCDHTVFCNDYASKALDDIGFVLKEENVNLGMSCEGGKITLRSIGGDGGLLCKNCFAERYYCKAHNIGELSDG